MRRIHRRDVRYLLRATLAAVLGGCATGTDLKPVAGAPFEHVFLVVLENHNYLSVVGSSAMPYLNGLISQGGLATQYYANGHPSISDYFMLAAGDTITHNDGWTTVVSEDNVVRELRGAGLSWRVYAEDLPSPGYTGSTSGQYVRRHNVYMYLSDVANDSAEARNVVPFTQLASDVAAGSLPAYGMIIPNLCHDADQCGLDSADAWLSHKVAPLIASPEFQSNSLLVVTFDESGADSTNGGGHIAWVVVSPRAKRGYRSTTTYQHESTLRLLLRALGLAALPNHAVRAPDMDEFFEP